MAVTLTLTGKTPGQIQFGLDTFTEHYKCDATADVVLTDGSVPAIGAAHPTYSTMFVTNRYCTETSETASALDLTYMGTLSGSLPAQKTDSSTAVQAASSSAARDGRRADPPLSLQFYAPTTTLSYISYTTPGTDTAPDPTGDIKAITLTVADQAISIGSGTIQDLIDGFFDVQILETHQSTEIVAGQYWQNVSQKVKSYTAFIFNVAPGPLIVLGNPGINYAPGDILTIGGGGGTASMTVVAVGISDSITSFTVSSATMINPAVGLPASGGSGTGATFNVVIVR